MDQTALLETMSPAKETILSAAPFCFHCGETCRDDRYVVAGRHFCCGGCQTVFELLRENGLEDFYSFSKAAGIKVAAPVRKDSYQYLDEPSVRRRLADFSDERTTLVTFRLPAMHCMACVWLLENLFRLQPGIGYSRVNFPRKEVFVSFETSRVKLSEVAALLASLGYEPQFDFSDLEEHPRPRVSRRLWLQLGVAGFAFGNIMLLSISSYLGLDAFAGPALQKMFGWISLTLGLPAVVIAGGDYWRAAGLAWKRRIFTIDVPIALGVAALALWSTGEVLAGRGPGYFDSLCGLLFFLLCGKWFQQKTYDRLAFDRDYKSFFPLSVLRRTGGVEERISLSQLQAGDEVIIRNGELIPADARLVAGPAMIDYSFVTGESEPVPKQADDHIYAGGRQIGGAITVQTLKEVSQSYLTSLWNRETFAKEQKTSFDTLTNRYSRSFTKIILAVAICAGLFWTFKDASRALPSFVSVLIVACPCALALAAPFTLGTAQRLLARRQIYLKNPGLVEVLARVDTIVFDKTGTLTASGAGPTAFSGAVLNEAEEAAVYSLARQSTHPYAVRIAETMGGMAAPRPVRSFVETAGCGIEGVVGGDEIWMGSTAWLQSREISIPGGPVPAGGVVHVVINKKHRGCYTLSSALRPRADAVLRRLAANYDLALLSGDNERERELFQGLFGGAGRLNFNQSPWHKLNFIRQLQAPGKTVMMVGDGLNDAGALKQSDAGVAVVESVGAFSPASDVIMAAAAVPQLHAVLQFARASVRVVRASLIFSALYNVIGVSIAARGLMSPVICAILMPVSSVTVVAFACGLTLRLGRRINNGGEEP